LRVPRSRIASGHREEVRVVGLGEVDDAPVIAEVLLLELRVAVDPEPADDERVEVPREEIGEVEGRRLGVVHLLPSGIPGEEAVAVGTGKALDAMNIEHVVERAPGAAVGVRHEDALVPAGELTQLLVDGRRDQLRPRVELRGEASNRHVPPAVEPDHGQHLARDRSAGENQHLGPLGLEDPLFVRI